jgi:predicted CoA-binding protein
MSASNPPDNRIRTLLSGTRTIAIVGASSNPERPSHEIMAMLLARGFHVVPVNPNEETVLGQKAYAALEDIPEAVDIVDVFRAPEHAPAIADSAVRIGARALWLQLGVVNDDAAARARDGGLMVVMDRCLAVAVATFGIGAARPGSPASPRAG